MISMSTVTTNKKERIIITIRRKTQSSQSEMIEYMPLYYYLIEVCEIEGKKSKIKY